MYKPDQRPNGINYFASVADLTARKMQRVSLIEVEQILAKHRRLNQFRWLEVFDNIDLTEAAAAQLIHPDRLAIVFLGEQIGYATIAIDEIQQGQLLLFSGTPRELIPADAVNPYINHVQGFYTDQPQKVVNVDSSKEGGFASMVTDVPSPLEYLKLQNKLFTPTTKAELNSILSQNFYYTSMIIDKNLKIRSGCIVASRVIQKYELLGCAYTWSARLMYTHFLVFLNNGNLACEEIISTMNSIAYKEILKRDLHRDLLPLIKILKYLTQNKSEKLASFLTFNIGVCDYLIDKEVDDIKTLLTTLISPEVTLKLAQRANLTAVQRENERTLFFLTRKSNQKQIANKGKGELFVPDFDKQEYYMGYEDIETDFFEIGKRHEALGRKNVAATYYQQSLYFLGKFNRSEKEQLRAEIETCHKRVSDSTPLRASNIST